MGKSGDKGEGKGKGACFTCRAMGHRAAECPSKGEGKGQKGKGKGWAKGCGQSQGWNQWQNTVSMTRACFGCGSTAHLFKDCPTKADRQVQEVTADEPEILFIGHTEATEIDGQWKEVPKQKCRKGMCDAPPGLNHDGVAKVDRFKALTAEDEEEDATCQMCEIMTVNGTTKNEGVEREKGAGQVWADLGMGEITVDSAADESCWPKDQGGAFQTKAEHSRPSRPGRTSY